ncbi:hypothetical protein G6F46_014283 [Rhizopus delemar]|nr:hypothetical protein G6F46_014283 [Rhizopus delemar]
MGRRVRAHRQRHGQRARTRHGRVLHVGPRLERSGLPVQPVRARIRHQQLPGLLEHVPRGHERRAAADDRLRQRHGVAGRLRRLRPDHFDGTQPRHQPSAHDGHLARMRAPRRTHHRVQPLAGTGARALRRPAERH